MKQFIAFITLAVTLGSGAHIRYVRDSGSYADAGANSRSGLTVAPAEPIAIVRSVFNGPTGDNPDFDFSYEAENGIKQETTGSMKEVDGAEVMVMRGSYSYIDENGDDVLVTWEADENGYRAKSDILPIAPEIPFEDQAIAVAAQIRFAQEELARNANSASQEDYSGASSQQSQTFAARTTTNYGAAPTPVISPAPASTAAPFRASAPASSGYTSGNAVEDIPTYESKPVVQEVRFVEVAQPRRQYEPVVEETRAVEPEPLNRYQSQSQVTNGRSTRTFGNERVSPVQAKSRSQPDYIRYLLE
ncbi:uncharacterized protein LOC131885015 [Tigriopus californicus]|uniref:uncharacterized protein LOC131885015 n=1 Tax=Tigriopus californicus TaxID=6832 RepID=UPI0027DA2CA7|nr:uncharacterized protein LOC131885015 [Tigriopus californicus]